MKIIKQSVRPHPKVSLILLDWSVRESFHLLHYLGRQNVDRNDFEVIIIEYYSRLSDALQPFSEQVDTWVLLEVPESCYYHKHLMYNAGIALSRGDICVICDSDAMVKEGFIGTIIGEFERTPDIILHIDQFRNNRRDFYPFNYPSFEEVLGEGCINNVNGKTSGVLDIEDPIHSRNYGACMCARREDLIAIGGADEHIDFLGHVCGPYEMTFRLVNLGRREIWHQSEFMYHTWHPGAAGVDNYLGPHDGRHVSTTALEALTSKRTMPLLENDAIRILRASSTNNGNLLDRIIRSEDFEYWSRENLEKGLVHRQLSALSAHIRNYKGFSIHCEQGLYYAHLLIEPDSGRQKSRHYKLYFEHTTIERLCKDIDKATPAIIGFLMSLSRLYILAWQFTSQTHAKMSDPATVKRVVLSIGNLFTSLIPPYRWQKNARQPSFDKRLLTDDLGNIIPNLHHYGEACQDTTTSGIPMLLVDSIRFTVYLKLIATMRALPPVQIIRMATTAQLRVFLSKYAAAEVKRPLILARGVYFRYYAIISADEHARHAAVI